MVLTGCPRGIWPMPEGHQGPPVVPGDLGPGPKHRRVDQLSRAIRALAQGPAVSTSHPGQLRSGSEGPRGRPDVPGDSAPGPRALDVNQMFRALGPGSEGPWGRPTVPRNSGPCPKARVFEQLSRVTRAWVRWPACSTRSPGPIALRSDGLHGRPATRETRARAQRPVVSTCCPGRIGPGSECPRCQPAVPGHSRLGPKALGVDQPSRATRAGSKARRC